MPPLYQRAGTVSRGRYTVTMTNEERAGLIVRDVLKEPVVACEAITGRGSVNLVYAITTPYQDVIVRMRERDDARVEYGKEVWCYRRAGESGIPGPRVLAVGQDDAGEYLVLTRVLGANGEDTPDALSVWKTLGGYARRIHTVPVTGFGNVLADAEADRFSNGHSPTWNEQLAYNLAQLTPTDALIALGVYDAEERGVVQAAFAELGTCRFQFGLNHGDLSPRNVIVSSSGETSLLDWGCAHVHAVPHSDLLTLPHWQLPLDPVTATFLQGYGLSGADYEALLPDLARLHVLRSFDVTRWAIDQHPESVVDRAERARQAWKWFSRR